MNSDTSLDAVRQAANVPAPRVVEQPWMSLGEWRNRHERQLAIPWRVESKLVWMGDSISEAWLETQPFQIRFAEHKPLNLGIGGDQTQHVLWRIEDGALDSLSPRLAVLLIGINNLTNGYQPEETVSGIEAVVLELLERLPESRLLLLHVLPAGREGPDEIRCAVNRTNELMLRLAQPGRVELLDIGDLLLEHDGTISEAMMGDYLHPTERAYAAMTDAIAPIVERLLESGTQR